MVRKRSLRSYTSQKGLVFANFAYIHKTAICKNDQFPTLNELIIKFIDE